MAAGSYLNLCNIFFNPWTANTAYWMTTIGVTLVITAAAATVATVTAEEGGGEAGGGELQFFPAAQVPINSDSFTLFFFNPLTSGAAHSMTTTAVSAMLATAAAVAVTTANRRSLPQFFNTTVTNIRDFLVTTHPVL